MENCKLHETNNNDLMLSVDTFNNQIDHEFTLWSWIEDLNWYTLSTTLQSKHLKTVMISQILSSPLLSNMNGLSNMQRFVCEKRKKMANVLRDYFHSTGRGCDDQYIHLISAYVVGLGRTTYQMICDKPQIIDSLIPVTHVDFEYLWDMAINELN